MWKSVKRNKLSALSALQKKLLEKGLRAYFGLVIDLALKNENLGCFGLREGKDTDPETMRQVAITDHRARAARRAAAGLAVVRLVRRGLVESVSRGHWRLTLRGFKVAKALYPELKPPTKKEVAGQISFIMTMRAAVTRPRRKRSSTARKSPGALGSSSTLPTNVRTAKELIVVEVEMDV
jgi:hypothetical protein